MNTLQNLKNFACVCVCVYNIVVLVYFVLRAIADEVRKYN